MTIPPMLSKLASALPEGDGWSFEPKWDGFRALVFREGDEPFLQSRDEKPLNRYFPELLEPLSSQLPARCILDGEIVIAGADGLDFEALQLAQQRAGRAGLQLDRDVRMLRREGGQDRRQPCAGRAFQRPEPQHTAHDPAAQFLLG